MTTTLIIDTMTGLPADPALVEAAIDADQSHGAAGDFIRSCLIIHAVAA